LEPRVISVKERRANPNPVDGLLEQIRQLQERIKVVRATCQHDFCLRVEPALIPTLVTGVYLPPEKRPIVVCLKCSQVSEFKCSKYAQVTCPICMADMEQGGEEPLQKYVGSDIRGRDREGVVFVSTCSNPDCGHRVISAYTWVNQYQDQDSD